MKEKYTLGLDIGTNSVGWAVIYDNNFKVMKKRRKALWGASLFNVAKTAEARRLSRSSRKRYDRRRQRIKLLQEEFNEEMDKVDNLFFAKLKESKYRKDDIENKKIEISKLEKEKYKELFGMHSGEYKTIYHLRKRLIENTTKEDIRLVYLAIHHIIKYRGNFLYGTGKFEINNIPIKEKLENVFEDLMGVYNIDYEELEQALYNKSKNDKKIFIEKELKNNFDSKIAKELTKALIGDKFDIATIFDIELEEKLKISYKGSEYDDNLSKIEQNLNEEQIEILNGLKEIYDNVYLKLLFKGSNAENISSLMVEKYNIFKEDLQNLKSLYRLNKKLYKRMFKTTNKKICDYDNYIKKGNYEEFTKIILKDFELINDNLLDENLRIIENNIIEKINNNTFMPKITDVDNGKYPFQLNEEELVKIIENQGKYYNFLLNKCNDGTYKIVKLLKFCIPYYVGPLGNTTSSPFFTNPNYWLKKKIENVKITPYNFNEVVDLDTSAENFINRMIGNCSYLLNEKVIPTNSILYSKFKVLNELKQIKVGDKGEEERLTIDMQKRIYQELFLKNNTVITDKKFKEYLKSTNEFSMYEDISVTGYSGDDRFANNMASFVDFFGENGFFKDTNYKIDDAEEIIRLITIFEDKEILKRRIDKEFVNLSEDVKKRICNKKYKGWSNLSKKLLTGIYYQDKETSINKSIITLMEETPENFMQIINNKEYNFDKKIKECNIIDNNAKLNYSLVKDLVTSPGAKRGIYIALKIVKEIVSYLGYEPTNIVLEMARGDEKKVRSYDRKKYIENLYNKHINEIGNYQKLKRELNNLNSKDIDDKLFLYFIQEGKSLYSNTPLDINRLDEYEIDHIIPRTLIKDNSLENKALVLREENQIKAANYVLPESFRNINNKGWWQHLKKINLISTKKYNNLCRYKFDQKSIEGFINRQLVETRQICKHVAHILENFYKESKVIYLSASLSHNYREKYELYKFREINNYHHAHDAYLAAVLGVYKENYLKLNVDYDALKTLNKKLFNENRYREIKDGYVINSLDPTLNEYFVNNETGEVFDALKFKETIENTLYRNDILISKKTEFNTGELFGKTMQPHPKEEKKKLSKSKGVPLKKGMDINKYGYYTGIISAYVCLVKYEKNNKEEQRMVRIPIYIDIESKKNINSKIDYLKDLLKLDSNNKIEIIKDKIPFNTLLDWKGQICYLVGATEDTVEVCNAKEFNINKDNMIKWKYTFKRLFSENKNKEKIIDDVSYHVQIDEIIKYIIEKIEKKYELYKDLLPKINKMFGEQELPNTTLENKEKIIKEMFKLLNTSSLTANMKSWNKDYSTAFGRKNKKTINHVKIINKSITGIWVKENEF